MRSISVIGGTTQTAMKEPTENFQNTSPGSRFEQHIPVYVHSTSQAPGAVSHLRRFGAVALVVSAVLMLCASVSALFLWKVTDRNVYNVRYSMNINGELREASMEIDSDNNLERFKPDKAEAVEIHDFQSGITGIHFFGGDKCYIKSQIKAKLPDVETENKELLTPDPRDEILPVKYDKEVITWIAMEQPLADTKFLSSKIIHLCRDVPIYWLQPTYLKDGERRRRDTARAKRQFNMRESEAAAEKRDSKEEASRAEDEEEDNGAQSVGSAFNPENPYHARSGGAGEEATVTFDPMLDHRGICCAECRRGYTHCQRICEPLRGHWPWPYHYRGCQVACRVIMPCRWWVARIRGLV